MPHLTLSWPTDLLARRTFWREAHRCLQQNINFVVVASSAAGSDRCARSIRRYALHHELPCIVKEVAGGVLVAFI